MIYRRPAMFMQLCLFTEAPASGTSDASWKQEEWREITDHPGYEVSSHGRFRNRRTEEMLKGTIAHNGYVHIGLYTKGKQKWFLAHRLVAQAFLPKPENAEVVNHKNRLRSDNRAANLEWCSRRENALHWLNACRESSFEAEQKEGPKQT